MVSNPEFPMRCSYDFRHLGASPGLLLEQKAPPVLEALFGWITCGDLEMMTALLERKASVNECLGCQE